MQVMKLFGSSKLWPFDAASNGLLTYISKTTALAIVAAFALHSTAIFIGVKLLGFSLPTAPVRSRGVLDWLQAVGVGPLAEATLLYLCCLFVFKNFQKPWLSGAVVIGLVAGTLHGLVSPFWFFGPAISFFIWSYSWFCWKSAQRPHSFLVLLVPHMIQNSLAMLLMS